MPTVQRSRLLPRQLVLLLSLLLPLLNVASRLAQGEPPKVTFAADILPILRQNCLACHSASQAEGGLILESLAKLRAGGQSGDPLAEGPAEDSYLYQVVAGLEEPAMPPADNKVGAQRLDDNQLALLKQWIEQGAAEGDLPATEEFAWQRINPAAVPVFATCLSADGRFVAVGRGGQLDVMHVATQRRWDRLVDAEVASRWKLPAAAHVDLIQSIAFQPRRRMAGVRWIPHRQALATSVLRDRVGSAECRSGRPHGCAVSIRAARHLYVL